MQPKTKDDLLRQALLSAGTDEHYEDAALYDHEYRRRRRDLRWYRSLAKGLAKAKGLGPILELGCGTGRLLLPLLRDGHRVIGVDRSRTMLDRCAERLASLDRRYRRKHYSERATLVQGDLRALPFLGDETFDLILCPFNAFMHLYSREDVERCLAEVRRLLSKTGIFALDVLMPDLSWLDRDPNRRWARTRFRHPTTGQRLVQSNSTIYDPVHQIALTRIFYDLESQEGTKAAHKADGGISPTVPPSIVVHLAQRQFFPEELRALFHYNGFTIESHEGGFDGEPMGPDSIEQVICARVK